MNAGNPCKSGGGGGKLGATLTASDGTILSPGYDDGKYPNDEWCKWQIIAPADKVKLTVMSV